MMRWLLWLWLLLPGAAAALPLLELDVALDPARRALTVRAELPAPGHAYRFSLHSSLAVRRAALDGQPVRIEAGAVVVDRREWRLRLPASSGRLHIEYGGDLPPLDRAADHRGVLTALAPMAAVEGSFLPSQGGWHPQPSGDFAYRVSLSLPPGQRGVVPGNLVSEDVPSGPGGRYRAIYEHLHPTNGIDLMAGPWTVREKRLQLPGGAPVRVRTWFDAELDGTPGLADGYLEDAARYLARYSELIGAYPWREFSVVASPLPVGLGMPALTYLGRDVIRLPFIRATSLGHEVLHNWWGNGVRVDAQAGNWSEGLTTFMADYAYRQDSSEDAARTMRLGWLRDAAALPATARRPLSAFRFRTHAAAASLGYGKAAMLFVMLRDEIGEQAFARGIRLLWERKRFQAASWDDLQAVFAEAAGKDLGIFFAQWLRRADAPRLRIAGARAVPGGTEVTLEQAQPAYDLRVVLQSLGRGGSAEHAVRLHQPRQVVLLRGAADSLRLDPELRLWRELDATQLPPIWRQWVATRQPRLVVLSEQAPMQQSTRALAARLFETPAAEAPLEIVREDRATVLLVGLHTEVDRALAQAGLPPRPAEVAATGSAQAWTVARRGGAAVAVVSVAGPDALAAIAGPLPHYGAQSWLVFEGRRMTARGVWPVDVPAVPVRH